MAEGKREPRIKVDWDAIEPHYRAGVRPLKEIGVEFSVSDAAIIKHAKKFAWTRNLAAKIQAKADEKVSAALVSAEVSGQKKITEASRIEAESDNQARVRLSQRKDISRAKDLVSKLFSEVENATVVEGQEPPIEILTIPQRVDCTKKLTDAAKTLIALEREAWGIKSEVEESDREVATITRRIILDGRRG